MDFVNSFYPQTGNCVGNVSACTFANSYEDIISLYGNVTYDESTDNGLYMNGSVLTVMNLFLPLALTIAITKNSSLKEMRM